MLPLHYDKKALLEEIKTLEIENWQLKGALGYPVPGDIPQGDFECGLCAAREKMEVLEVKLDDRIMELEKESRELRMLLWAHHCNHYPYLYGDDGELHCAKCMVDFKRDDVSDIRAGIRMED
jgi:hypothetical protein